MEVQKTDNTNSTQTDDENRDLNVQNFDADKSNDVKPQDKDKSKCDKKVNEKKRKKSYSKNTILTISALGYLFFPLPLIFCRKEPFAMYHFNQALVMMLFMVVFYLIFAFIPNVNRIAVPIVILFHLIAIIMGMGHAFKGRAKPIPLIGKIVLVNWEK